MPKKQSSFKVTSVYKVFDAVMILLFIYIKRLLNKYSPYGL